MPALLSAIAEVAIARDNQYLETSAKLEYIITHMTSPSNANEEAAGEPVTSGESQSLTALAECSSARERPRPVMDSALTETLRITTSMPRMVCDLACNCQCHIRMQYRTPQWVSAVIGSLFYSSTFTPAPDVRRCNSTKCFRSKPYSSSRFTYYFPAWMIRTAHVYCSWSNLQGTNSSWVIRMPREISDESKCWTYIEFGRTEGIKQLLMSKDMSPYDVNDMGDSVLYVCIYSILIYVILCASNDVYSARSFAKCPISASCLWRPGLTGISKIKWEG